MYTRRYSTDETFMHPIKKERSIRHVDRFRQGAHPREAWRETMPCTRISIIHDDPRARLSSVPFTRAISSHHAKQKPSEDSASRSFPFVLSRERITIVREAIRARPRLALRASEISQNYTVISGGDINAHTVRTYTQPGLFLRERHLCNGGLGYEDVRASLGIFASSFSSPPLPPSCGKHFHKLPHKAYSHPGHASCRQNGYVGINYIWMEPREVS